MKKINLKNYYLLLIFTFILIFQLSCLNDTDLVINKLGQSAVIDGLEDEIWQNVNEQIISEPYEGKVNWGGKNDLSGSFKMGWNEEGLFIFFKIADDIKFNVPYKECEISNEYRDCIKVLIDVNNDSKYLVKDKFKDDDVYIYIAYGSDNIEGNLKNYDGIAVNINDTDIGYNCELKIPWNILGIYPKEKKHFGFQAYILDADNRVLEPGVYSIYETSMSWANKGLGVRYSKDHTNTVFKGIILH